MALDPRLANVELLALAALRVKSRQGTPDDPHNVIWLEGLPGDPPREALSPSGIYLPRKCATEAEWYASVARFRVPRCTA
jgi:hypothetical protein